MDQRFLAHVFETVEMVARSIMADIASVIHGTLAFNAHMANSAQDGAVALCQYKFPQNINYLVRWSDSPSVFEDDARARVARIWAEVVNAIPSLSKDMEPLVSSIRTPKTVVVRVFVWGYLLMTLSSTSPEDWHALVDTHGGATYVLVPSAPPQRICPFHGTLIEMQRVC